LQKDSKKNIEKKLCGYFTSIDELPLHNWIQCTKGDIKYVRTDKNGTEQQDREAWEKIYNEYLQRYGLAKTYKRYLEQLKKITQAELDYVIKEDRFKLTVMEMEKQRLEQMVNNFGSGISIEAMLIHLCKWIGYFIKTKNITVVEYFNLMKEYERSNKLENGKENKQ
jgi:hypothetical protein